MKLLPMAFVNIETTGLHAKKDNIIEIAIIIYNGQTIDTFHSLLNPNLSLPKHITHLTGIDNDMLIQQPTFEQVAEKLYTLLQDTLLVAHNVRFEYAFLKHAFNLCGYSYQPKQLCTLKLSKVLFPQEKTHRLIDLVKRYGLSTQANHRALNDALAIYEFWQYLEQYIDNETLYQSCEKLIKRPSLPNQLQVDWNNVHNGYGVYLIYGDNDLPLYIGKSKNVKNRLLSHFSQDVHEFKEMALSQQAKRLEIEKCEGEIDSLITESLKIKQLQPLLNRKLRRQKNIFTCFLNVNTKGYYFLEIINIEQMDVSNSEKTYFGLFATKKQAWQWAMSLFEKTSICLQVLNLEKGMTGKPCFRYQLKYCHGACIGKISVAEHNQMVEEILQQQNQFEYWPFIGPAVIREGRIWHVIDHWLYLGKAHNISQLATLLAQKRGSLDKDIYHILVNHRHLLTPIEEIIKS